jgi:hypothetical protein
VVLEGPMGAVLFWTTLGLANSQLRRGSRLDPGLLPVKEDGISPEWPVAKPAPLDTHCVPR